MSIEYKDYYKTLDVSRSATEDEIKKAFRKLARLYHPDVAKDKATADSKFKEINEAYEVLGDPVKRKKYDELGSNWQQRSDPAGGAHSRGAQHTAGGPEFHFGGTGFSDFFEQFFSGSSQFGHEQAGRSGAAYGPGFSSQPQKRRGVDVEGDIMVSLEEAMHGTVRPLSLQMSHPQTGEATTRSFKVRIPPGVTDGRRIRVPGQGQPGIGGGPSGDLFLRVRHSGHPDFRSRGSDIFHDLEIAPWEAVLGTEIVVPTLKGSVKLRIPAGTENDRQFRIKGRGLPARTQGDQAGDFFVVIHIAVPTTINDNERELWQNLRDQSTFKPRKSAT